MGIIHESTRLQERRHFLIRALDNHNITQSEYDKEVPELEKQIEENLEKRLIEEDEILKSEIHQIKQAIPTDGDMKRAIAKMTIKFLSQHLQRSEVKGVLRQGYKIMRREG